MEDIRINRRKKLPEANLQAEIYHYCKIHHINCMLEVRYKNCRFDVVILDKFDHIILIIETKSYKNPNRQPNPESKQLIKYNSLGIPLITATKMERVPALIRYIEEHFPDGLEINF